MNDILLKVQEVARQEIDNDDIVLQLDTLPSEIEGWDSIALIQIIASLEEHYKITFPTIAIYNWKNIGDICQSIHSLT